MARRPVTLLVALAAACPSTAAAAPVLQLGPGGHVRTRNDPFVTTPAVTPVPMASVPRAQATTRSRGQATTRSRGQATTRSRGPASTRAHATALERALERLRRTGAITSSAYRSYAASLHSALVTARRLRGTRGRELAAVIGNLRELAGTGRLSASRLPALFATLDRNRQWWTSGALLGYGQRVEFSGSELVWEYYPGQGIELQVLGSFAKADALYTAGPAQYPRLRELLTELTHLAVTRGGGLVWEYYFHFDGGSPPWTSAMSQGTALEALTRGFEASGETVYLALARRALPIFGVAPPVGVALPTAVGTRYLQYSFAPGVAIVNAFLQALIGLYDYAHVSGDPRAQRLFAAGDAEARAELPHYDTGAWSLYQPGIEDSLDYHVLVTGFLRELCARTRAPAYCDTAQRFDAYLTTLPALQLLTHSAPQRKPSTVSFRLSKYSHVGIVVELGARIVFLTSAYFPYGVNGFQVPALSPSGTYTIRLAATDLAGNFSRISDTVQVR